ncbi:hypothetical protein G3R49_00495 [Shewanella sp. WXL01]|uniref:Uncharacterized protein n=1 Tax=Shewanella maritima TaxID=2520507 RepID=A0A411PH61_9GAMM|nr:MULTISPECIES: hypothetical protein [Shewanella]NKF49054.1 hypothetical protein [Shewanella sp. WXL01]QBF82804.1 hypothetical protein EXU30_08945 [Shewanella maritima]
MFKPRQYATPHLGSCVLSMVSLNPMSLMWQEDLIHHGDFAPIMLMYKLQLYCASSKLLPKDAADDKFSGAELQLLHLFKHVDVYQSNF